VQVILEPRIWKTRLALALGLSIVLHAFVVTYARFDARSVPQPARLSASLVQTEAAGRAAGVVSTEPQVPVQRIAPPPVPLQQASKAPAPSAPPVIPQAAARRLDSGDAKPRGPADASAGPAPAPALPAHIPLGERPAYWLGVRIASSVEPDWVGQREVDGYRLEEWLAQDKVSKPVSRGRIAPIVDPRRERMERLRALVELLVLVDETGRVVEVAVLDGAPPARLIDAARDAVLKSEFRPAELDGRPVKSRMYLRIRYDME